MFLKGKSQETDSNDLLSNWVHLSDSAALFPTAECLVFQSRVLNNPATEEDSISQRDYPTACWISLSSCPFSSAMESPCPLLWPGQGFPLLWIQSSPNLPKAMPQPQHCCLPPASVTAHPVLPGPAARAVDMRPPAWRWEGAGLLPPQRWGFCLRSHRWLWAPGSQHGEICSPQLHVHLNF